jgi:hypothetical protein
MVIAAIIVKHKLGLDDGGCVEMISENIYLQYFCGLKSFQTQIPFHPTVFVDIRKRMGSSSFDSWNVLIMEKADQLKPTKHKMIYNNNDKDNNPNEPCCSSNNKGKLKIDASVANQKIVFPTDAGLLNTARKESERMIDLLCKKVATGIKPRDYRRIARTEYLVFSKKRRKSKKVIRKFIRKQISYLKQPSLLVRFLPTYRIPPYLKILDQSTNHIELAYRQAICLVIMPRFYSDYYSFNYYS